MIGLMTGALILGWVVFSSIQGENAATLVNAHSVILVGAGSVGVLIVATPGATLSTLLRMIFKGRKQKHASLKATHEALLTLSRSRQAALGANAHPLIARAQELWRAGVSAELFETMLSHRAEDLNQSGLRAVAALRNLAKYPPALGMTGTVIGLVGLFSNLTPEKKGMLGPSLAMAMTATFYGLILANMIVMPLSDRLHVLHLEEIRLNDHVFKTLLLVHQGEPKTVLEGEFRQYAA